MRAYMMREVLSGICRSGVGSGRILCREQAGLLKRYPQNLRSVLSAFAMYRSILSFLSESSALENATSMRSLCFIRCGTCISSGKYKGQLQPTLYVF
jgi:hypothetical protein